MNPYGKEPLPATNLPLQGKEKAVAYLTLIAGLVYLIIDLISIYTIVGETEKMKIGLLTIRKLETGLHLKMIGLGLLAIAGAILFLKRKRWGWIISAAMMLNLLFISGLFFLLAASVNTRDVSTYFTFGLLVLNLLAFLQLFGKETRAKFGIRGLDYLWMLLLYGAMIAAFAIST
jgi:hypothetical protein